MPPSRTSRRSSAPPSEPKVLAFLGTGVLAAKAIGSLLDDFGDIEAVYLPATDADFTDETGHVNAWAIKNDIPVYTVSDDAGLADQTIKKVIDAAAEDWAVEEKGLAGTLVDVLLEHTGDAERVVVFFFDKNSDADIDAYEVAYGADLACFDICDSMSPMTAADDEPTADAAPEPEPEPAPRRGSRAAAKPELEPEKPSGPFVNRIDELLKLSVVDLKKDIKKLDPAMTTEELRGRDKEYLADLLATMERDAGPSDEAQANIPPPAGRTRRSAATKSAEPVDEPADEPADEPEEGEEEEDPKAAAFGRLRASRETQEAVARSMHKALVALTMDIPEAEQVETATAALAVGVMAFADYLITEIRKPKSKGRPRADGSEAQPRTPAAPAEKPAAPAAPARRRRSS